MTVRVNLMCKLKGNHHQLEDFLEKNLEAVRGFKGCLEVRILFDESKETMLIDEDWQSIDSHQHYLSFIQNNGVLDQLKSFMTHEPTLHYFQLSEL